MLQNQYKYQVIFINFKNFENFYYFKNKAVAKVNFFNYKKI